MYIFLYAVALRLRYSRPNVVRAYRIPMGKIGLQGLSINLEHTGGWIPEDGSFSSPAMRETDLNTLYQFCGRLKGMSILYRMGFVDHSLDTDGEDYNDHRVIVNYIF